MSTLRTLRAAPRSFWLSALRWTGASALAVGVPTVLIPNALFRRMTPARWWDFLIWGIASALTGLVMGARKLPSARACAVERRTLAGGGLAYLAVGCPVCNKIVVAILGVSGALSYFAPIQPLIGIGAVMLLAWTLRRRLRPASGLTQQESTA